MAEAARVATSDGVMEGHDAPPDVLTGVIRCGRGGTVLLRIFEVCRGRALDGAAYCQNEG